MRALSNPSARGMTLVELMVVVSIAGILAGLAYPGYSRYLYRSHRTGALNALMHVQTAQERWRATHPAYANSLKELNLDTLVSETSGHYQLSLEADALGGYLATATAIGRQQADTACTTLSLQVRSGQVQTRSTGTATADECWGMR